METTTERKYKAGDRHPLYSLLAFVEYDENGVGWWTSIATDPEAPFRLCSANTLHRDCGRRDETATGKIGGAFVQPIIPARTVV